MGAFLSSIFAGANPTLGADIKRSGQQATYDTGEGESDINAGTSFLKKILGGDATTTTQLLAPEISAEKKAAQQDQKTTAMTGGRTGGTAAVNATSADKVHADITDMIAKLTGTAATALPSIGTNLTAQGTEATGQEAALSQEQLKNFQDSILGKSIGEGVQAAETAGLGAVAGALPGGPGAAAGAQGALSDYF